MNRNAYLRTTGFLAGVVAGAAVLYSHGDHTPSSEKIKVYQTAKKIAYALGEVEYHEDPQILDPISRRYKENHLEVSLYTHDGAKEVVVWYDNELVFRGTEEPVKKHTGMSNDRNATIGIYRTDPAVDGWLEEFNTLAQELPQ